MGSAWSLNVIVLIKKKGNHQRTKTRVTRFMDRLMSKLNGRYTAQMIFLKKKDTFELTFHKTHTHEISARYVSLSEKTCEMICGLMKAGFSEDHILKHFKSSPIEHRDHYVEEKDLQQIADRYGLNHLWRSHSEDAKSVYPFVEQNPDKVIFYQPKIKEGEIVVQDFIFVIQTQRQTEYVRNKRIFRFICADSTHNIRAKKKMATIMTVDEDETGVSLAFCFCESKDTVTMQKFFAAVKKNVGFQIEADYFLSDDANSFYNAWCAEMTSDNQPHKRLCAWHVNKAWISNLGQFINEPIKPEELNRKGEPITKRSKCKSLVFGAIGT